MWGRVCTTGVRAGTAYKGAVVKFQFHRYDQRVCIQLLFVGTWRMRMS